jgi:hypothetical protein
LVFGIWSFPALFSPLPQAGSFPSPLRRERAGQG